MRTISATFSIIRTPSLFKNLFKVRKLSQVSQTADRFVLNNPELIEKRRAVVKYLNRTDFLPSEVITDRIGDYKLDNLYDNKVGELLDLCGDDLSKIDQLLGLYGLAEYAEVTPETIIKDRDLKIKEGRYCKDSSFRGSFYWYLLANENTPLSDLDSRFGKMGESLYKDASMLGFVKTGYNYSITSLGKEYLPFHLTIIQSKESAEDFETLFGESAK
jgi:hypothetical protein